MLIEPSGFTQIFPGVSYFTIRQRCIAMRIRELVTRGSSIPI